MKPEVAFMKQQPEDERFWIAVRARLAGPGHKNAPLLIAMPTSSEDIMGNSSVGLCIRCKKGIWVPEHAQLLGQQLIMACKECYRLASDEVMGRVGVA